MSNVYVTTETSGIEALVESVQEQVSRMAYQYHRSRSGFSYEDLLSVGMVAVTSAVVKNFPKVKFPHAAKKRYRRQRAYLLITARRAIIRHCQNGSADPLKRPLKVHPSPLVSLDGDGRFSLYDEIAAPDLLASEDDRDFSLLYDVVNDLPDRYRQVICMRFGLCGYGVHRSCEIARILRISQDAVYGRVQAALAELRKHAELLTLVGGCGDRGSSSVVVAVCQYDGDELARLIADFEATPSYCERFADGREVWEYEQD